VQRLSAGDLSLIAEVDRSEHIDVEYTVVDGRLEERPVSMAEIPAVGEDLDMRDKPSVPGQSTDEVTDDGVFHAVRDGYEAVYAALPQGETFGRIWRDNAYRGEFPIEFAHIGFLTLTEAQRMLDALELGTGDTLVDLACGAGGPGLWTAQQSGASVIGVDPAMAGLAAAERRAKNVGLDDRARFQHGTFERTGLPDGIADAAMTIEAFQYAPDKPAALAEFFRILKPGGRVAIVCFEVDPARVAGLPVLGVDPVSDYAPLLEDAQFTIDLYEETPGWADRVYPTFRALVDASDALNAEMGERAAAGTLAEAMLTVAMRPYPRRVLIVARRSS
jgi:ubiquinone/menaquinone biosynthesis C-methylase UbiE